MCLKTFTDEPKVAEEDIVCYKFLRLLGDGTLFSPYQGFTYELGKEYSAEFTVFPNEYYEFSKVGPECTKTVKIHYAIEQGLHSIHGADRADFYADQYSEVYNSTYAVVECVIPKGAYYYEGTWYGKPGYASNRLTATKILQEYTSRYMPEEKEDVS